MAWGAYLTALERPGELQPDLAKTLRSYNRFVQRERHKLARWPSLVVAPAVAQPQKSPMDTHALELMNRRQAEVP